MIDTYERIYKKMFTCLGLTGGEEKELSTTGQYSLRLIWNFFQSQVVLVGKGRRCNNTSDGRGLHWSMIITCDVVDKNVKKFPFTYQLLVNCLVTFFM